MMRTPFNPYLFLMPSDAQQEYATFTYYPRINLTSVASSNNRNAEAGVGGLSAGVGSGTESSAEGTARPIAGRPLTIVIEAGS